VRSDVTSAPAGPAPLVTLDRVDVRLAGALVLSEVSLELVAGEGLAVLGPNGSGKSTLLRLLRGDVWPDPGSRGRRLFHGEAGPSESPIGLRARLPLVAPEAQDAYVRRDRDLPVEAVIRSGFFDALWPEAAATPAQARRVAEVAEEMGVGGLLGRSMLELSRGEGRRVLLARALVNGPAALLLDEACDGLDAGARAGFLALVSAAARSGTAVVMATHRTEELPPELGRVVRIERGRIVAQGARAALLPDAPPALEAPAPARGPARATEPGPTVFDLQDVTVLREGRAVLAGLDWTVRAGERWSIVGENGAGKSTLLRLLAGEEQPARGGIDRLGLGPRAGLEELRGRVGVVSPELQARHRLDATGEEVLLSGFAGTIGLAVPPTPAQRGRAEATAVRLELGDLLARHVLSLSYGELRRLLLARALAPGPEALLLDEPLAGLDPAARAWVSNLLDGLGPEGPALVCVSHHGDELPRGATRLRLAGGRLVRIE
jgi:molybdate transport system ATP-binding protein